jgi:hypothetical protein
MDFNQKLYHAAISSCVFLVASLPYGYGKTNGFLSASGDCPTYKSKLLHTLGFFALSLLVMKFIGKADKPLELMVKYATYSSLLFFLLSSTEAFKLTGSLVDGLADESGCPTLTGVAVHTLVYGGVLMLLMSLPKDE